MPVVAASPVTAAFNAQAPSSRKVSDTIRLTAIHPAYSCWTAQVEEKSNQWPPERGK
jgi:hypothetical protein